MKTIEKYDKDVLKRFEELGFSEQEVEAMYSVDPETGTTRLAEIMDINDNNINNWFEFAIDIGSFAPHLAIPIFEEMYKYDCNYGDEANIGGMYYSIGQLEKACEWYKKSMQRNLYNDQLYMAIVRSYLECQKKLGQHEDIPEIILHLLQYTTKRDDISWEIWTTIADIYGGDYGIEACLDIELACLIKARKCLTSNNIPDISPKIDHIKKTNPHLYETAKNLNILEAIRKNLAGTGQKTNSNVQEVADSQLTLRVGERVDITRCQAQITALGYVKSSIVFQQGQMVRRGGIIDVFPFGSKDPYRIDWLDDCIDSIRTYDSKSMLSKERCDAVVIAAKQEPPQKQNEDKKPKVRVSRRRQQPKQYDDGSKFTERHYQIIINVLVAIVLLLCYLLYAKG